MQCDCNNSSDPLTYNPPQNLPVEALYSNLSPSPAVFTAITVISYLCPGDRLPNTTVVKLV